MIDARSRKNKHFVRLHICVLAASLLLSAGALTSDATASSPYSMKELLTRTKIERAERQFPVPLRIVRIESVAGGGWSGTLDDRWNSSDAFQGNFRDEFLEGLSYYLKARGYELSSEPSAMVVKATVDEFEGRKRVHDDGGDLRGTLTLLRNGEAVGKKELFESLSYRDESVERRAFAKDFGLTEIRFSTVLFYRLSLSFYRSIDAGLQESLNEKATVGGEGAAEQAGRVTQPASTQGKNDNTGLLTIESSPEDAEILLDGKLIATTPAKQLRLPAGNHTLVLRKRGYQDWSRDVMILAGNDLILRASLEKSGQ